MTKKSDIENPTKQVAVPPLSDKHDAPKKTPIVLPLFGLVFCLATAAIVVGSLALSKVNELDTTLDQLSSTVCNEPTLVPGASVTFPPLMPNPPYLSFVPAFQDPSWFGVPGNRLVYSNDPMFPDGTTDFTAEAAIGTVSGELTVLKPLTNPNDPPMFNAFLTFRLDDTEGEAVVGGINDVGGETHLPILGGTGEWENFSGYLKSEFDPVRTQVSLKMYQTCSQ